MFTGIVSNVGRITRLVRKQHEMQMEITTKDGYFTDLTIGQSVMTNGVCLTITAKTATSMQADVMMPTFDTTNFKYLKINDEVHLEKALLANGRLDGHVVMGHVDGVGKITKKQLVNQTLWLEIYAPDQIKQIVTKGSIAIDGMSLTVVKANGPRFTVALIPHTQAVTLLANKPIGAVVNLETDILAKYLLRGVMK
ncbi:riboflavin synthase [Periweissella fabalis]|uniref:Riboflavin synthase n=1 Tax=Periweissella fabalis TaxID=1070421 RepID=A0A7X6S3F4_9LACO|nr:riboflavin synthase [Periweissella fabalis]MCM0598425.1 riboflavin synthase [Periweissella fabalis]NKZ25054.1 riboflavin synthase [Periweissella fabalis]